MIRWWEHAACKGMDLEIFYPARGESLETAREVCRTCPVRRECLQAALEGEDGCHGLRCGVWGGVSARGRDRVVAGTFTEPPLVLSPRPGVCSECGGRLLGRQDRRTCSQNCRQRRSRRLAS